MSFNSLEFLIYLPVVVLLYWVLPQKIRWVWLLAASYFFYMSWNPELVFLILGTTVVSYTGGIIIEKVKTQRAKKWTMALCVIVCIGVLIVFKYLNFLLQSVYDFLSLFSLKLDPITLNLVLPIGISFYTFQTLSYVIDVYRGTIKAERHFGYYALFVSFFPQLVAGPIERPGDLLPQLRGEHTPCLENFEVGIKYLLSGFIKKVVVADFIGIFVDNAFGNVDAANGLTMLLASVLFFLQVYCDFSGYSDIAMGSARMMGIRLTQNFNRPFMATSMHDFWKRWHISLTRWFIDYLYIPLGGSRKGKIRAYLNTLIVFGMSGLWHGANWTFLIWGLIAAVMQIIESSLRKPVRALAKKLNFNLGSCWMLWLRRIFILLTAGIDSIFFRASSLAQAGQVFKKIFTDFFGGGFSSSFSIMEMQVIDVLLLVALIALLNTLCYLTKEKGKQLPSTPTLQPAPVRSVKLVAYFAAVLVIALAWLMMISLDGVSSFVYFQF